MARERPFMDSFTRYLTIAHHLIWTLIGVAILIGILVVVIIGPDKLVGDALSGIGGEESSGQSSGEPSADGGEAASSTNDPWASEDTDQIAGDLLFGGISPPQGFDACVRGRLPSGRLDDLRSGRAGGWQGSDIEASKSCLRELGVSPESLQAR